MTSKQFRKQVKNAGSDKNLFREIESLLSNYGLEDVTVFGFTVSSTFNLEDKKKCEEEEQGEYVCRMENGKMKCECQGL